MGTVFAIANPEAAVRILYEVYPATKPTGKDVERAAEGANEADGPFSAACR